MADVTIGQLDSGIPSGSHFIPFSTGLATNKTLVSSLTANALSIIPNFIKAFCKANSNNTISNAYNVQSNSYSGGIHTITFTNALPNSNYLVFATTDYSGLMGGVMVYERATTYVKIYVLNSGGNAQPSDINVLVIQI